MMNGRVFSLGALVLLVCGMAGVSFGRASLQTENGKSRSGAAAATPDYCLASHNVGKLNLAVTNYGVFGAGSGFIKGSAVDCFTGEQVLSCEYPKGSRSRYLYSGAFWVGAVVGRDTLVSVGADGWTGSQEFFPDEEPFGHMKYRSIMDPSRPEYTDAISEQDYVSVYTDTFTTGVSGLEADEVDARPHIPIHIEVGQRSFAWSYPYAEDFVLFDYGIRNIGVERIKQVYIGLYIDADVYEEGFDQSTLGFDDDICGFHQVLPTVYGGCDWIDTVNLAWIADNDGELDSRTGNPLPHVTAVRIVRTPSDSLKISFNWWVSNGDATRDFGPQWKNSVRDLGHGGLGTPSGDRNKYYFMRNGEFDYDQVYTAGIRPTDTLWAYPSQLLARNISDGYDTRYLLSFGPFDIDPGQTLPLSFAYVAGADLHQDASNMSANLDDGYDPTTYYENLDFSDLALNSMWASWVYDNPGVDTDTNGYAGEFRECVKGANKPASPGATVDTIWYIGDGVPDFRGASPPPAPDVWIEPDVGKIRVRWNGLRSETTRDVFSRSLDFEGYRVYIARDEREASYTLLASFDIEDYQRLEFTADGWELLVAPFTLDSLKVLYGDGFDPNEFTRNRPFRVEEPTPTEENPDSTEWKTYYFEFQDYNRSVLGVTSPIVKAYPDAEYPVTLNPDSALAEDLTPDGYLKYFEYEFVVENLLPTVPYYINVTAFDYGSPQSGLGALETSKTVGARVGYPLSTVQDVAAHDLEVYTYPNPYRADGGYREMGFEGRGSIYNIKDRERRIHFANLPAKCTIRIYSLDGDLIREIFHDVDPADPMASHETWDLITRNTQMVVSGLYYWTVEDDNGKTQIGKLVVIL